MAEAVPYKITPVRAVPELIHNDSKAISNEESKTSNIRNMVKENPVIVIGWRGCCMSHVAKLLLQALGVNPAVYEVDGDDRSIVKELEMVAIGAAGDGVQLPAVFIGGRLFGGLDRIMATHITGELVPVLKKAGALWL